MPVRGRPFLGRNMTAAVDAATLAVVVIDSQSVVRAGIRAWCHESRAPIEVVDDFADSDEFFSAYSAGSPGVDVVLLDPARGGKVDASVIREICSAGFRTVVYSHIGNAHAIRSALDSGAATYLVKSEGRDHLIDALLSANTDTPHIGPLMAAALSNDPTIDRPLLAPREQEVLIAWFRTESKNVVAEQLFISTSTVRTHLQRIRAKYAAAGRPAATKAALVARAIQDGLIGIDEL